MPGLEQTNIFIGQKHKTHQKVGFVLAERMGFEPMNRFWRLHTFQACAFDHSAISPLKGLQNYEYSHNYQMIFNPKWKLLRNH